MELLQKHRAKIALSLLLGIVIYGVLVLLSDTRQLAAEASQFQWDLVPAILGLTLFNYALRFLKWHYYLGVVGVKRVPWRESLLIFLSGFSMTLTPGKAGEFLKAFLVKERTGTPVSITSPIVLAERLTDGLALLLLALSSVYLFDSPQVRLVLVIIIVLTALIVGLFQRRSLAARLMTWMERAPVLARRMHSIHAFYASSFALLQFRTLALAIGLGVVSWAGECFALALVLVGLGVPFSWQLVSLSAFAMGFATLAGSLLLVPGGLGVAEASLDGLLLAFGRPPWLPYGLITQPLAAAATLVIRFATLWFGWLLGLMCLTLISRHPRPARTPEHAKPRL